MIVVAITHRDVREAIQKTVKRCQRCREGCRSYQRLCPVESVSYNALETRPMLLLCTVYRMGTWGCATV